MQERPAIVIASVQFLAGDGSTGSRRGAAIGHGCSGRGLSEPFTPVENARRRRDHRRGASSFGIGGCAGGLVAGGGQDTPEALDVIAQKEFPQFATHVPSVNAICCQNLLSTEDQGVVVTSRGQRRTGKGSGTSSARGDKNSDRRKGTGRRERGCGSM